MSVATDAIDRFIQPRRKVSIRRDENDFVIVLQPEDFVVFRNADECAAESLSFPSVGSCERYRS